MNLWEQTRSAFRDGALDRLGAVELELNADRGITPKLRSAIEAEIMAARGDREGARSKLLEAAKTRTLGGLEKLILGLLQSENHLEAKRLFREAEQAGVEDARLAEGLAM